MFKAHRKQVMNLQTLGDLNGMLYTALVFARDVMNAFGVVYG